MLAALLSVALAAPPTVAMDGMVMPALKAGPFPHAERIVSPRPTLPAIPLVQTDDRPFQLGDLRGRWVWLYLGYTNCPDACPLTLGYLAGEYRLLQHPERVQTVFCSVDPGRDTPEKLTKYVQYFHPGFLGVTGTSENLNALAHAVGTRFVVEKPRHPGEAYVVDHPDDVFLIDPQGRLAAVYHPDALMGGGVLATDTDAQPATGLAEDNLPAIAPPPDFDTGAAWCGQMPGKPADQARDALMARMRTLGSGTSVLPAAAPMRMWSLSHDAWLWMFQAQAVAGLDSQQSPRGSTAWAAENYGMAMGSRPWGPGVLDLHLMGSLEPLTMPPAGTPQLFQLGEFHGTTPYVDAQHPHDLLMELAARYTWNLDGRTALFLYGGPAAEPALGPVAFMHRPSAAENHWVPLGHHMQDSTHVSYGVATVGVRRDAFQWEVSAFNGREPDDNRFNLDLGPLDSTSTRLSWFPGANWSLQASVGRLHDVEAAAQARFGTSDPGEQLRMTASALNVQATPLGTLSSTLVWGEALDLSGGASQSYGLESELDAGSHHVYGRYELADRPGLGTPTPRVNALTLGYLREVIANDRIDLGVGVDATAYSLDTSLVPLYGPNPYAFRVYLRLAPPLMPMGTMGGMNGM